MSETTTEERELHTHPAKDVCLRCAADVERLKQECEAWQDALLDNTHRLMQVEAQRDDAVGALEALQTDARAAEDTSSIGHWDSLRNAERFLAGLSTTPEVDVIYMTRDQKERREKTCERISVCCEEPGWASVGPAGTAHVLCCAKCFEAASFKCATHHGPWPSDTKRCPAAMTGNVTT